MKRLQPTTQRHLSDERRRSQMQLPVSGWSNSLCSGIGQGHSESAQFFSQAVDLIIDLASPRLGSEQDYTAINQGLNSRTPILEAGDKRRLLSQ